MSATNIQAIIDAWHGLADRWIARRNKMHGDGRQWEVAHDWGGDVISDETQRVVERFTSERDAHALADKLENEARARAVLALFQ